MGIPGKAHVPGNPLLPSWIPLLTVGFALGMETSNENHNQNTTFLVYQHTPEGLAQGTINLVLINDVHVGIMDTFTFLKSSMSNHRTFLHLRAKPFSFHTV